MPEHLQGAAFFVGRRFELEQFERAIKPDGSFSGLLFGPGVGVRSLIFVLHGMGGIGKTWLARECLRRAKLKKWATVEIDWSGLDVLPNDQVGLMNEIATAIKDHYGEKTTQQYEGKRDRARRVWEGIQLFQHENPEKWQYFSGGGSETGIDPYAQGGNALIKDWAIGTTGQLTGMRSYMLTRAEDNFIEWLLRTGQINSGDDLLFRNQKKALAIELVNTMRQATTREPLVLLFDGCQVLPPELEEWLRDSIVCPLAKSGVPLIFILSGRQDQYHQRYASSVDGKSMPLKGYADRLTAPAPVNWSLGCLCDPDVAELLARAGLPAETFLVDFVQARSGGIPLAVQMVIQSLQKMGGDFIRDRYYLIDSSSYPYEETISIVTRSFLESELESESLRRRVYALALVRPFDEYGLRAVLELPEETSTRDALGDMARRTSLIAPGGKILQLVRDFIRHDLRINQESEARRLGKLAADALLAVWQQGPGDACPLAERVALPAWRKTALDVVNALCWSNEQEALQFLSARVIESRLFDPGFAGHLVAVTDEFNIPPDWFSAKGHRILSVLRMIAARETGSKNNYDFILEKCTYLGLNNQHCAILNILQAQDPFQTNQANSMLRNLLIAEGQLATAPDLSIQQMLAASIAECIWQPGPGGAGIPAGVATKVQSVQDEASVGTKILDPDRSEISENGKEIATDHPVTESDIEELHKLARFYYGSNKFDEALDTYNRAIKANPANAKSWNGLGMVLNALNRMEDAIAAYRKAIELEPAFVEPWNGLGALYNDIKNSEQAIIAFRRAAELDPSDAIPWNGLGNVYHSDHEDEQAVAAFKKAIELNPRFAHPWNGLGYVYRHQNMLDEAITAFNKAIELHPLFALPWNGLGFIFRARNDNQQAMIAYKKAIEINPRFAISWNGLGYIYRDLFRMDDAISAFNKAIEFDPQFAAAWNGLGNVYGALKKYEQALTVYQKATQFDSGKASYWNGLANTYRELGNTEKCIEAYRKAVELDPNYASAWYGLGAILGMLGQDEQALDAFIKAVEIEPGWAYPWNGLGNVYFDLGNFDKAFDSYSKAIELAPELAAAWSGLANVHIQCGDDEKAAQANRKVLDLSTENVT